MSGGLQGRRALVTGASRGLGAAIALRLAADGVDVAATARSRDRLAWLATSAPAGRVLPIPADLSDPDAPLTVVGEVVSRLGGVDILINNASSVDPLGPFAGVDDQSLAEALAVGLTAPLRMVRAVLRQMTERRWGRVVNISSGAAVAPGITWAATYSMSKTAVEAATIALASESTGTGVTVNAVRPGTMATEMQRRMRGAAPEELPLHTRRRFERLWQEGTLADPSVAASFVVQLLSTEVNGRVLDVRTDTAVLRRAAREEHDA